jgi:dihydropteroate synthase
MGVVNVTPDSFAETVHLDIEGAVDLGLRLENEGADLLDVGGESTRPGAVALSAGEELARVLPVVRALASRVRIPISIDTYKAEVARAAIDAGAAIVNDVSGLRLDSALASIAARGEAALIVTHSRGRSATMYAEAQYDDIAKDVSSELQETLERALAGGVTREGVIIDPGIGFAKRPQHSYGVLARLPEIAMALERPILVGPSRKSFMGAALDNRPAPERDWGTAAAVAAAVLAGAHIVRVHAVAEMVQVARVSEEIRRHG